MAGRPRIFDQAEVLSKTIELFWKNGYESTSTNELLKEVNLNKGSLYNIFRSKKELFQAGLKALEQGALDRLELSLEKSQTPIEDIKAIFYDMLDATYQDDCKGCILGNSIIEFTGKDEEVKALAESYLLRFESILIHTIQKGKDSGALNSEKTAKLLARFLINFWNGINITRRVYKDKKELKELIDLNMSLIY